jgi:hypothetical protein
MIEVPLVIVYLLLFKLSFVSCQVSRQELLCVVR